MLESVALSSSRVRAGNAVEIGDSGAAVTGYETSISHPNFRGRRGGRLDARSQKTARRDQLGNFAPKERAYSAAFHSSIFSQNFASCCDWCAVVRGCGRGTVRIRRENPSTAAPRCDCTQPGAPVYRPYGSFAEQFRTTATDDGCPLARCLQSRTMLLQPDAALS